MIEGSSLDLTLLMRRDQSAIERGQQKLTQWWRWQGVEWTRVGHWCGHVNSGYMHQLSGSAASSSRGRAGGMSVRKVPEWQVVTGRTNPWHRHNWHLDLFLIR